ncbi:MAG TPA: hypothetical protein HPP79_14105, partial [Gammaproteobacteria bacterium]|nr:hypothetical protein [Gammaproteobacteria bacterium]
GVENGVTVDLQSGTTTIESSYHNFSVGTVNIGNNASSSTILNLTATSPETLTNDGIINLTNGLLHGDSEIQISTETLLNNDSGIINVQQGLGGSNSVRTIDGSLTNNGTINLTHDLTVYLYSSDVFTQHGTVDLGADTTLTVQYGTMVVGSDSIFTGTGDINFADTTALNLDSDFISAHTMAASGTLTIGSTDATAHTFENDGTLTLTGDSISSTINLNNDGTLNIDSYYTYVDGGFHNATLGTTNIGNSTAYLNKLSLSSASGLTNDGTINITSNYSSSNGYGELEVTNGTLINNGTIHIFQGAGGVNTNHLIDGAVNNTSTGLIDIDHNLTVTNFGSSITNSGTIDIASGATATLSGSGTMLINDIGATIQGGGSVTVDMLTNSGTIGPGNSAGTLTINGDFVNNSDGVINLEVGGTNSGEYDQLVVNGNATLGGTLNISILNGFTPGSAFTLKLLDVSGSVSGIFTTVNTPSAAGWGISVGTDGDGDLAVHITTPVTATNDTGAVNEDATLNVSNASGILSNDINTDSGETLTVTTIRTGDENGSGTSGSIGTALTGTYGTLTLQSDGSYSYIADQAAADALASGVTATDYFTYTVDDGRGSTDTAQLTITVTGTNDGPTANTDTNSVNEDATLNINAVSGVIQNNDVDLDDAMTVTTIRTGTEAGSGTSGTIGSALIGTYGTLTINSDGSYDYSADQIAADALANGASGNDVFTYTITDTAGATDTAELVVTVNGLNDAPTLSSMAGAVDSIDSGNEVEITFTELTTQGDETDIDGTVSAFIVQAVTNGTLMIGTTSATATAFHASTNNTIDATYKGYWTPDGNATGTQTAFTIKAADDLGELSLSPVNVEITVNPIISVSDQVVTEGDTATFTITLSGSTSQTVTVDYATQDNGTTAAVDYTAVSGTLTFAAGETSKTVAITTTNDSIGESAERISFALSNASNALLTRSSTTAVTLDGNGDYIKVQDQSVLDISGSMTIEGWFKPTEGVGTEILVARWDYANSDRSFQLYLSNGALYYNLSDDGTNSISSGGGMGASLSTNAWAHVALVYDQTAGAVYGYLNGELIHTRLISASEDPGFSGIHQGNSDLLFGEQMAGHGGYFQGEMDEIRLWSSARSETEIQNTMYEELAGSETNLNGYWKFNEGDSNIAENSSVATGGAAASGELDAIVLDNGGWNLNSGNTLRENSSGTDQQTTTALHFGGGANASNHGTDFVSVSYNSVLLPTSTLSLEVWVYFDTLNSTLGSSTHTIIDTASNESGVNSGYTLSAGGGEVKLAIGQSAAWSEAVTSGAGLTTGTWYHIAATYDSSGTTHLYIDGVDHVANASAMSGVIHYADTPNLTIGTATDPDYDSRTLDGKVDEVRIWSDVRTSAEVSTNMNQELEGNEAGLEGYWKLNEGDGTTILNQTDHAGLDGSIQGNVAWDGNSGNPVSYDTIHAIVTVEDNDAIQLDGGANTSSGTQRTPSMTALNNGNYIVVWEGTHALENGSSADGTAIIGQIINAAGEKLGTEFIVNAGTTGNQGTSGLDVATLTDGHFVVTWFDAADEITMRIFQENGTPATADIIVSDTSDFEAYPKVTALTDGNFVVSWTIDSSNATYTDSPDAINHIIYDNTGSELYTGTDESFQYGPSAIDNSTVTAKNQYNITALESGEYMATYSSNSGAGANGWDIYARILNSDGSQKQAEFKINTTDAGNQSTPAVAALKSGGFIAVWTDENDGDGAGNGYAVIAQRYEYSSGSSSWVKSGNEIQVNSYITGNQQTPMVTGLEGGGFAVTWLSMSQDGDDWGVYSQRFDAEGSKVGSEQLVNVITANQQLDPDITALDNDSYAISWYDNTDDIFTRIYTDPAQVDPIIIDLGRDGINIVSASTENHFAMTPDGSMTPTNWLSADDGFLALDLDNDGVINNITELFSEYYQGERYASGLDALRTLDENSDGFVDALDSQFDKLQVWQDLNQDGVSDSNELQSLSATGVTHFDLNMDSTNQVVGQSLIMSEGAAQLSDGGSLTFAEVALSVTPAIVDTPNSFLFGENLDLSAAINTQDLGRGWVELIFGAPQVETVQIEDLLELESHEIPMVTHTEPLVDNAEWLNHPIHSGASDGYAMEGFEVNLQMHQQTYQLILDSVILDNT